MRCSMLYKYTSNPSGEGPGTTGKVKIFIFYPLVLWWIRWTHYEVVRGRLEEEEREWGRGSGGNVNPSPLLILLTDTYRELEINQGIHNSPHTYYNMIYWFAILVTRPCGNLILCITYGFHVSHSLMRNGAKLGRTFLPRNVRHLETWTSRVSATRNSRYPGSFRPIPWLGEMRCKKQVNFFSVSFFKMIKFDF